MQTSTAVDHRVRFSKHIRNKLRILQGRLNRTNRLHPR